MIIFGTALWVRERYYDAVLTDPGSLVREDWRSPLRHASILGSEGGGWG